MPTRWTAKEERQYEHIKQSAAERGAPQKEAKAIAARTVNKTRRKRGETRNKTSQGTGNPRAALRDLTKQELYNRAKQLHVAGRSRMDKGDLVRAIQSRH